MGSKRDDKQPRGWLWPIVGTGAVIVFWLASAAANWWAGHSLSDDVLTANVLGAASIACDVMKAVSLFVVVAALGIKRYAVALVALMVFALCATWSMRSATYFASSMLTAHVTQAHVEREMFNSKKDLFEIKKARLGFLAQQGVEVATDNKSARRDTLGERVRSSKEFNTLMRTAEAEQSQLAQTRVPAGKDPIADMLKLDEREVILATAVFFAVLLEVVSGVGFWMIAQSRRPKVMREPTKNEPGYGASPYPSKGGGGSSGPSGGGGGTGTIRAVPQPPPSPTNVVTLVVPAGKPMNGHAQKDPDYTRVLTSLVGEMFVAGAADDRVRAGVIRQLVNARLPGDRKLGKNACQGYLLPAALTLNQRAHWARSGGQSYVYGLRLREHVGASLRQQARA